MMFAIFTLTLACSMSVCPMQAYAAEVPEQAKSDMPPCHGSSEKSSDCDFMTNMDCLGVDLLQVDHDCDLAQDSSLDVVWANPTVDGNGFLYSSTVIRGPPFDDRVSHLNNHDLYLTTQRLRI